HVRRGERNHWEIFVVGESFSNDFVIAWSARFSPAPCRELPFLFSCGQLLLHGRGLGSFPHNAGSVSLFRPIAVKAFCLAISPALIARADAIALAVGSTALEMPLEADRTEFMLCGRRSERRERWLRCSGSHYF